MEYLIYPDYGIQILPEEIKVKIKDDNFRYGKIIQLINQMYPINISSRSFSKDFYAKHSYLRSEDYPNRITFLLSKNRMSDSSVEIIDVDIERPWTLTEYDGSEDILYLDNYVCVNKKTNQHELRKED